MTTSIYFLRHCKTSYNTHHLISGGENIPIIERNIDISNISFKQSSRVLIISSPLRRCVQTTYLLKNELNINPKIIFDKRLVEREMGQLQGKNKSTITIQYPYYFSPRKKFIPTLTPPDGESYDLFFKRVQSFSQYLLNVSINYDDVIVSSHNQTLKMLYAILFNLNIKDIWDHLDFANGKVTKIHNEVLKLEGKRTHGNSIWFNRK